MLLNTKEAPAERCARNHPEFAKVAEIGIPLQQLIAAERGCWPEEVELCSVLCSPPLGEGTNGYCHIAAKGRPPMCGFCTGLRVPPDIELDPTDGSVQIGQESMQLIMGTNKAA